MPQSIVMAAGWHEIVVGAILVAALGIPSCSLFAAKPEGIGMPLARFAGICTLRVGYSLCALRDAESRRGAVLGLFVFNVGIVGLPAWLGLATRRQRRADSFPHPDAYSEALQA